MLEHKIILGHRRYPIRQGGRKGGRERGSKGGGRDGGREKQTLLMQKTLIIESGSDSIVLPCKKTTPFSVLF